MRFRKLRIAFSVTCLIACVLLIALWVRSYSYRHPFFSGVSVSEHISLKYYHGYLYLVRMKSGGYESNPEIEHIDPAVYLHLVGEKYDPSVVSDAFPPTSEFAWTKWQWNWAGTQIDKIQVPVCFPVLLVATLAAAPWLSWLLWRFSLRTLLIGMTLIAVGLGLVVWLGS